jgi:hypothetical protein
MRQKKRAWCRFAGLLVCLLAGSAVGGPIPPAVGGSLDRPLAIKDLDSERVAAREALLEDLEGLAGWCTRKRLFLKRQGVYESMIHFDPGNKLAMRGLGYIKDKDGNWKETERRVEAKDWNQSAARQFPKKRAEAVEGYRDTMFGLLKKYEGQLSSKQTNATLDEILFADPDDARVRKLRGESKRDGIWVLSQTMVAKERRKALRELVIKAFKDAPEPTEGLANKKEEVFGISWKAVFTTPLVRSLGTGSKSEVSRMTQAMSAAHTYFNGVLSVEANFPAEFTVYTLVRPSDKMAFLMGHPVVDQAYRDFLFQLEGSGIQGSGDLAHWSEDVDRRLDGLVRQAIMWLFAESYQILPKHGWAFEGFGLYMTRELIGTRLTWFVKPSVYLVEADDMALQARLLDTRTNWMNEANQVLSSPERPKLAFLLGKDVNELTTEDLLYSYVLSAYLIESEYAKIPKIFGRIGKGESSVTVLEEELGLKLDKLDEHVRRWLSERH